jgi:SAM-dependent methyltransferase/uncharacterized protein YbaR (Trm112 family)
MDSRIVPNLRCPVSRFPLALHIIEAEQRDGRQLVRTGILYCGASKHWYPIVNYVPVLLTFSTQLVDRFRVNHAGEFGSLDGYTAPSLPPMPGERSVQKTFTEEWSGLGSDETTFIYSDAELLALHRDVWLRFTTEECDKVETVLNIGVGFGKESSILSKIFPRADVFAIDLNLALLQAGPTLNPLPRVHPIIASLFRLPFQPGTIDHVHSQGVIHHAHSTQAAFQAISVFPRRGGSLFIWVYAQEDSLVVHGISGVLIRMYWLTSHYIGRPVLSRLPAPMRNVAMVVLTALLYPIVKLRSRRGREWHFRNTLHGLRDAFTPRYAHQHGFNEVIAWFEDSGFEPKLHSPSRYRDLIGKRLIGIGIVGRQLSDRRSSC